MKIYVFTYYTMNSGVEDYKYRGGKELVYDWDEGIAP